MKLLRAVLFVSSCVALAHAEPIQWNPDLTGTATWNSNVTNADRDSDVIGALQLRADLAAFSRRIGLGRNDALVMALAASAETWPRFTGLDRVAFGVQLGWQHKFGLGPLAPVLRFELSGDAISARESDRSGPMGSAQIVWRQRFDEATQVSATLESARTDARETLYDRTGTEFTLEGLREVNETWQVAVAARWRDGDVLSYATPPRADLVGLARVRELVGTFGQPRVAYSVRAHSWSGILTARRVLGESSSVAFAYEGRVTERSTLRYVNHLVSAAFNRQF